MDTEKPATDIRPLILITNDDAIDAPGLDVLVRVAAEFGDVIAVAPVLPQSGKSSAITVDGPLRINQLADRHGARRFTVSGTYHTATRSRHTRKNPPITAPM